MQPRITGHHVDVTEALKNYVTERFTSLSHHSDRVLKAHIVLSAEKLLRKVEAALQVAGTALFRYKEKSNDHGR